MHKFLLPLFFFVSLSNNLKAQELIEFSMGTGYTYDIFYSLENGIMGYSNRTNWELAFSTDQSHNNIRINSGAGVTLFKVSEDLNDWTQIQSVSSNDIQLRNSYMDWSIGAFVSDASGAFNFGWGNYNQDTYTTTGNSIYIINYGSESKKMVINSAFSGLFNVTIANLDGSSEENFEVNTSNYLNKKFIYYSLTNMELIDREPDVDSWDLLFTKYEADLNKSNNDSELFYIVTGALSNNNLIFEYDGFLDVDPGLDMIIENNSPDINIIGWDWKEYSEGYTIIPNRSYYILNSSSSSLYKLVFQSFAGGSTGNCSFIIENLEFQPIHISDTELIDFNVYPNPNTGYFKISAGLNFNRVIIKDINGRLIIDNKYEHGMIYDLTKFNQGIYCLILENNKSYIKKKIIVQN